MTEFTRDQHQVLFLSRMMLVPPRALLERRFEDLDECPYGLTWQEVYDSIHEAKAPVFNLDGSLTDSNESCADASRRLFGTGSGPLMDIYEATSRSYEKPLSPETQDSVDLVDKVIKLTFDGLFERDPEKLPPSAWDEWLIGDTMGMASRGRDQGAHDDVLSPRSKQEDPRRQRNRAARVRRKGRNGARRRS